ncbi:MAG: alpha/beta hydrolase [Bauldia sp.]|nr:alpha/beta hydrolase [Bauldia sp.]
MNRRGLLRAGIGLAALSAVRPAGARPMTTPRTALVPFASSPFPYDGIVPVKDIPFLDASEGKRRGHTSPRAGKVYWQDETYSDRRSLVYVPAGFDLARPALIVVFFHGNAATLERDVVARQGVPRQLAASGLNAVLLAPQFAVDALDSSSGNFWTPGGFGRYLDEAAGKLADAYGDPAARATFATLPVVIVAYSGGYNAAAYAAGVGGADGRLAGVVLIDALYAEEDRLADWIARNRETAFLFSAYTKSAAPNNAVLRTLLDARSVAYTVRRPKRLTPGSVTFLATDPDLDHNDLVTHAWVDDPIAWTLARIPGYPR